MKSINKRIKEHNMEVFELWDAPSRSGYPTKKSLIITILTKEVSDGLHYGISLKRVGDEPIPRIGKAIAYRNYMNAKEGENFFLYCTTEEFDSGIPYLVERMLKNNHIHLSSTEKMRIRSLSNELLVQSVLVNQCEEIC